MRLRPPLGRCGTNELATDVAQRWRAVASQRSCRRALEIKRPGHRQLPFFEFTAKVAGPEAIQLEQRDGSRIIGDLSPGLLSHDLGGSVDLKFARDGFACASNWPQGRSGQRAFDFVEPWRREARDNICRPGSTSLAANKALASAVDAAKLIACSVRPVAPCHPVR